MINLYIKGEKSNRLSCPVLCHVCSCSSCAGSPLRSAGHSASPSRLPRQAVLSEESRSNKTEWQSPRLCVVAGVVVSRWGKWDGFKGTNLRAWEFPQGTLRILTSPTRSLTGSCQSSVSPSPPSPWTSGDQKLKLQQKCPCTIIPGSFQPQSTRNTPCQNGFCHFIQIRGHKPQDLKCVKFTGNKAAHIPASLPPLPHTLLHSSLHVWGEGLHPSLKAEDGRKKDGNAGGAGVLVV